MATSKGVAYSFKIKLTIAKNGSDEQTAFGPGIMRLLRGIETAGSLNRATKEMNMAYSKAWKLIKGVEKSLDLTLLERTRGAGGSTLTAEGKELIETFLAMEEAAYAAAAVVFNENYNR